MASKKKKKKKRRRGASLTGEDAAPLVEVIEHTLFCFERGCPKCLDYEEFLDAEGGHGLAQAIRTAQIATEGAVLTALVLELLKTVKQGRQSPTVSGTRGITEFTLQRIAQQLGFDLPPPKIPQAPPKRRPKVID